VTHRSSSSSASTGRTVDKAHTRKPRNRGVRRGRSTGLHPTAPHAGKSRNCKCKSKSIRLSEPTARASPLRSCSAHLKTATVLGINHRPRAFFWPDGGRERLRSDRRALTRALTQILRIDLLWSARGNDSLPCMRGSLTSDHGNTDHGAGFAKRSIRFCIRASTESPLLAMANSRWGAPAPYLRRRSFVPTAFRTVSAGR
jgi:hypothetical protein